MENEDLKKAFDFDLNIDFNERKYSKEVLKFVKKYSKKSGLEKLEFIEKKSQNYNPKRFFELINEIEHCFKKIEKEIDLQDRLLNNSQEYGEKEIKERGKIQKKRDDLRQAKDSWKINLKGYFKKFHSENSSSIEEPQQTNNSETLRDFVFKNNFDKVKENTVIEYFKTNLVEKKHISETVLKNFLDLAFDKKTLPIQKFSFEKLNTQKNIVQIFYNYYKTTAGKPYRKQKEYLNLLCNYFNGFENFNIKNFSK